MNKAKLTDKVLIAIMGQKGSRKSTFISLATQSDTAVKGIENSLNPALNHFGIAPSFYLDGREVILYDAPGFNNANESENEVLRIISTEINHQYYEGVTLHGIIYITSVSDTLVDGFDKATISILGKMCGEAFLKNVIILTDKCGSISDKERGERSNDESNFFNPALVNGAHFMPHTRDTVEGVHRIIRSILKNYSLPSNTQLDVVDEWNGVPNIVAQIEVDKKIKELTEQWEKKLKGQIEATEQVRKEFDRAKKELLRDLNSTKETIANLEMEKAKQDEIYRNFQREFEERLKNEAEKFRKTEAALTKRIQDLEVQKKGGVIPQSLCGSWYGVFMTDHTNVTIQRGAMLITMWMSGGECQGEGNDADGKFTFRLRCFSGKTLTFEKNILGYIWTYQGSISDDGCHINGRWTDDGRYGGINGQFFLNQSS